MIIGSDSKQKLIFKSSPETKAFNTVSRDGLWKIVAKFGCPPRYIAIERQFHDDMQARVQNDGEYSGLIPESQCGFRKDNG